MHSNRNLQRSTTTVIEKWSYMESNTDLNNSITKLNELLAKDVSFKRNLWLSIVKGAAGAIGATIVASIVVSLVAYAFRGVPAVEKVVNQVEEQGH